MILQNITKRYGDKTVLAIPQYEFLPGRIYAVIGANGSGKSTLARIMAGALAADSGEVKTAAGESIGYLPQKSYAFALSVLQNTMLSQRPTPQNRMRAMELLDSLGLSALAGQRANRLSGGETARMALARVMMGEHRLLLLDEPTAAMDVEATLLAEAAIRAYRDAHGAGVLLVTHSIRQAARLADEVLFFRGGVLWESGSVGELLSSPKKRETKEFLDFYSE